MKSYVWGVYKGIAHSLIEVNESNNQLVLRPIGTNTHLTLHSLEVMSEASDFYQVKYQNEIRYLPKSQFLPMSWGLSDPILRNTWSEETVIAARKIGFSNPEKHAYSVQNLISANAKHGYRICVINIRLNNSTTKKKYLNIDKKIGEILIPNDNFMMEFVFTPPNENQFYENYNFVIGTKLGNIYLITN